MLAGKTLCKVWNQKNTGAKSQRRVFILCGLEKRVHPSSIVI